MEGHGNGEDQCHQIRRGDVIKDKLRTCRGHEVLVALARKNGKEIEEI